MFSPASPENIITLVIEMPPLLNDDCSTSLGLVNQQIMQCTYSSLCLCVLEI